VNEITFFKSEFILIETVSCQLYADYQPKKSECYQYVLNQTEFAPQFANILGASMWKIRSKKQWPEPVVCENK